MVVSVFDVIGNGETRYLCRCDCGNTSIVRRSNLRKGVTKSCGCIKRERIRESHKKYNVYDLTGEYGIGFTTNSNHVFYFDLEDYDLIKEHTWIENDQGYIISSDGKTRQHRLIFNNYNLNNSDIDHKNGIRFDNRKDNLRQTNKQLNGINRGPNINNSTGIKGVSRVGNKYIARIMVNYKNIHLGCFDTIEEARLARVTAEKGYYGEFAYIDLKGGDSFVQ